MFRMETAVEVKDDRAVVVGAGFQRLVIVGDPPGELWGDQRLAEHIGAEVVDHFRQDNPGFLVFVWSGQHLAIGEGMPLCFVILDIGDGDRIVSPGMREENLTVDTELLIKPFLVPL